MRLLLERWTSPAVGELLLVTDDEGTLRGLEFAANEARLRRLLGVHYPNVAFEGGDAPASLKRSLEAYLNGDVEALAGVATATNGTAFQRAVWAALRTIPAGTTLSYGQLATKLGRKGASRAVGAANGANPIPIVVPCHRVIGTDGSLTGFGSGLDRKRWLLDHEARHAAATTDV
jgi:methylated-DNA-[protein]-cysteine S-methyltransferase